jgi:hypothetical protein
MISEDSNNPKVCALRHKIIDLASQVTRIVGGPPTTINYMLSDYACSTAVSTCIEFEIFTKVPMDGSEITIDELQAHAGFSKDKLWRLMRILNTKHIFQEVRPGIWRHSPMSLHLAKNAGICALYLTA